MTLVSTRVTAVPAAFRTILPTALLTVAASGSALASPPPAPAETVLHTFASDPDGAYPEAPLIRGRNGSYYGTTRVGAPTQTPFGTQISTGTVFSITPAGVLTTLHTFSPFDLTGTEGAFPSFGALVQDSEGNLYGMTLQGGMEGLGTIYRITPDGQFSVIHSFDGTDGLNPYGGLIEGSDGNLYGTTSGCCGSSQGSFGPPPPPPPLLNLGSIFKATPDGIVTLLHGFTGGAESAVPISLMQGADGNLYGTTAGQADLGIGSTDKGSAFRITPQGVLTTLHRFSGGSDGALPVALIESDGIFYGTTAGYISGSDTDSGTVFAMAPDGSVTTLHTFSGAGDGANPNGGLVQGPHGHFYGTTIAGGSANQGTVFAIGASGRFQTIYSFTGGSDGSAPSAALLPGRFADFLYGTTATGGTSNFGTVFRIAIVAGR